MEENSEEVGTAIAMFITIDRIEGTLAIVEMDGHWIHWPLSSLPPGTREGAQLEVQIRPCPLGSPPPTQLPSGPDILDL